MQENKNNTQTNKHRNESIIHLLLEKSKQTVQENKQRSPVRRVRLLNLIIEH